MGQLAPSPNRPVRAERTVKKADAQISDAKRPGSEVLASRPPIPPADDAEVLPQEPLIPAPISASRSPDPLSGDPKVEAEPLIPAPGSVMSASGSLDPPSRDTKVLAEPVSRSREPLSRDQKVLPQEARVSASLLRVSLSGHLKLKAQPTVPKSSNSRMGRSGNPDAVLAPQHIFAGHRFIFLGIVVSPELEKDITSRGGQILPSHQYEFCTHLCVNGQPDGIHITGPKVVTKAWIHNCCRYNRVDGTENFINELWKTHHQFFLCPVDQSMIDQRSCLFSMSEAIRRCKFKTKQVVTPGGTNHESRVTNEWLTLIIKESHDVIRRLHLAGLCLRGRYGAENLIVYEAMGQLFVRLGYLQEDAVEGHSSEGEQLDLEEFDEMVRSTIFKNSIPGHEVNLWLTMLLDPKLKELVSDSVLMKKTEDHSEAFTKLHEELLNASTLVRDDVLEQLSQYNGWQEIFKSSEVNLYLEETFEYGEDPKEGTKRGKSRRKSGSEHEKSRRKSGSKRYKDTVLELLRLLRNTRQHRALVHSSLFALVVGQNFPNLISHLQTALFLAKKKHH